MEAVLYDGSFQGFLSAVFDVYAYQFNDCVIVAEARFQGNIFGKVHTVITSEKHALRVWKGLEQKLSPEALVKFYRTFLSEQKGIEDVLLQYIRYCLASKKNIEKDFSHPAVIEIEQVARKVWREKHRMEAFVRFQQTRDNIYYALIEPDYNVLPLIIPHFRDRYADQRWMIWDGIRKNGIYYDLVDVHEVDVSFMPGTNGGKDIQVIYDEHEPIYQQLWQQYFRSVNIPARNNKKLYLKHMPVRYWKHLPEKRV
jgi:probable DNA metabolism protein